MRSFSRCLKTSKHHCSQCDCIDFGFLFIISTHQSFSSLKRKIWHVQSYFLQFVDNYATFYEVSRLKIVTCVVVVFVVVVVVLISGLILRLGDNSRESANVGLLVVAEVWSEVVSISEEDPLLLRVSKSSSLIFRISTTLSLSVVDVVVCSVEEDVVVTESLRIPELPAEHKCLLRETSRGESTPVEKYFSI